MLILKPCPFCGGTDLLKYHIYQAADACSACIECECCGASGRKYDVKVDQDGMLEDFDEYKQCLIDEWNHRPTEEKLERIIEDAGEEIAELKEELEEVEGFAQEVMELSGITDEVTGYDIENFGVSASNVEDAFRRKFLGDEDNEIHK